MVVKAICERKFLQHLKKDFRKNWLMFPNLHTQKCIQVQI